MVQFVLSDSLSIFRRALRVITFMVSQIMMSIRHCLESADGIERRAQRRYPVTTDVSLTLIDGDREHSCLVEDVSMGGARLRFTGAITLADQFEVAHPELGRFSSNGSWVSGGVLGLAFDSQEAAIRLCVHCLKQMVPIRGTA